MALTIVPEAAQRTRKDGQASILPALVGRMER